MSSEDWDATYRASGELIFDHELGSRRVTAPQTFHGQMSHHPGEDYSLRLGAVPHEGPVVGFILGFRDPSGRRLSRIDLIQPRYGGVSVSYGLSPRRPFRWMSMAVGSTVVSRMDDRFLLDFKRTHETGWELRVEAQNESNPPSWLSSGFFRLELNSLDKPWRNVLVSFDTRAKRQSARGRITLTLAHHGLVYPRYPQN